MMKKIYLLLLLSLALSPVCAQMADSTIAKRFENIELNLQRSHDSYRGGTVMVLTGMLVTGLALSMEDAEMSRSITFVGGGLITIGGMIQIDSHKYLGRIRKAAKKIK